MARESRAVKATPGASAPGTGAIRLGDGGGPGGLRADRRSVGVLLLILIVAAALRVPLLSESPPGLHQDEAINAWDAYCLLATGKDSTGQPWPIFYARGFGSNRTALFIYLLLPFEAIGGLGVWAARLPAALAGIAAVGLIFVVGRRLFGAPVGLVAAGLLAISPWAIQQSRWANEAGISVLLVLLPIAALLRADLPLATWSGTSPSATWAALGGVLTGVCCYGYYAVRLFLPLFLIVTVIANWRAWWTTLRTRPGARAIGALAIAVAATFGPLAWRHLADPEAMNLRGRQTYVWSESDSWGVKAGKALARYPGHFGPDFLFLRGDVLEFQSPPGGGMLRWYVLPLLLVGMGASARRWRGSPAARMILIWALLYPAGDLVSRHDQGSMHALRSLPGLPGLLLVAAVGAVTGYELLSRRRRKVGRAAVLFIGAVAALETGRFVWLFFGEYPLRPAVYHAFHTDLLKACDWLRPRFAGLAAVFCTPTYMNMPFAVMLVGLEHDPMRWLAESHTVVPVGGWDFYVRAGKLHFLYGREWEPALRALEHNGQNDRVVFLVRPGELGIQGGVARIDGPPGTQPLLISERVL